MTVRTRSSARRLVISAWSCAAAIVLTLLVAAPASATELAACDYVEAGPPGDQGNRIEIRFRGFDPLVELSVLGEEVQVIEHVYEDGDLDDDGILDENEIGAEGFVAHAIACTGPSPTVTNIDSIEVLRSNPLSSDTLVINWSGRPFENPFEQFFDRRQRAVPGAGLSRVVGRIARLPASNSIHTGADGFLGPGATPEADGSSEIEISFTAGARGDLLLLMGGPDADLIRAGALSGSRSGVNLNAGEKIPDVDVETKGVELVFAELDRGADLFSAAGGPGFSGQWPGWTWAFGGGGDDELVGARRFDYLIGDGGRDVISGRNGRDLIAGGRGADRLRGGAGRDQVGPGPGGDLVATGPGRDTVFARGEGQDRVRCGSNPRDLAFVDGKDKVRGCERINPPPPGSRP